jgi:hypothetical protein
VLQRRFDLSGIFTLFKKQKPDMKKTFIILSAAVMVWGCSKKMAPASSNTPSSNTGSVSTINNNNTGTTTPVGKETTSPATPTPMNATEATGARPTSAPLSPEIAQQMAGQNTYNMKCGRCHGLKVVTDYGDVRWVEIMAVMATKANLNETEKANVLAYVRANAKK